MNKHCCIAIFILILIAYPRIISAQQTGSITYEKVEYDTILTIERELNKYILDLKFGTLDERINAIVSMGNIGPMAIKAAPELIKALNNTNEDIREASAEALIKIDTAVAPIDVEAEARKAVDLKAVQDAVLEIIELFHDADKYKRLAAVKVLSKVRPVINEVVTTLKTALTDTDIGVRCAASSALTKIGSPDCLKALKQFEKWDEQRIAAIKEEQKKQKIIDKKKKQGASKRKKDAIKKFCTAADSFSFYIAYRKERYHYKIEDNEQNEMIRLYEKLYKEYANALINLRDEIGLEETVLFLNKYYPSLPR